MASLHLLLAACLPILCLATKGVDLSSATSEASFHCLKGDGYDFAVVRCYESVGRPDPACPGSVINAWNGGMAHVDVYMFPDPSKGNPEGQVADLVQALANAGIHTRAAPPKSYGMLWLDIEGTQYWGGNQGNNRAFFEGLVSGARAHGQYLGVYTSASQWDPIMGSGYTGGSSLPLWYAHYDGSASFSDFSPFGGWAHPSIKQFQGTTSLCGAGIDLSWYPDFGLLNATHPHNNVVV